MARKKIDWKNYNKELVNRGKITLWFDPNNTASWYSSHNPKKNGRPFTYSIVAIEILCVLKIKFNMTLRSVQGFAESLFSLIKKDIKIPNYSTLSRRMGKIEVSLNESCATDGPIDVVIDSSGLKVYGEGEWKVKIHGRQKHRTWRKIHLAVNPKNNKILSATLSSNSFKDSQIFEELLDQVEKIRSVGADGAYDSNNCFNYIEKRKAKANIPTRKNAKISKRGSQKPRDKIIREIRAQGRRQWKKSTGYHKRSLAETAMSRFKSISGEKLKSRKFENQATEALLKCKILNKFRTPKGLELCN